MLSHQLAQNLYREIEGLKGQLEKVTNDHRVLQQDFVEMELDYKQEKEEMMVKIDYLTELAGCGVPDDWVDDQGNEGENCKAVNLWNKWQEKWCSEYQHDGDEKPKCWWELVDVIDQRNDELGNLRIQEVDRFQKRDHERLASLLESQKEVDALTKKNLEMASQIDLMGIAAGANISASENRERDYRQQIDSLRTVCEANISASDNRERDYRQQIDKLESAAADAAEAMGNLSKEVTQLKEELDRYKNSSTQENEGYWFKRYTQKSARTAELDKEVSEHQDQINEMGQRFENRDRDYRAQINELNDENTVLENKIYDLEYTLREIMRIGGEAQVRQEEEDE